MDWRCITRLAQDTEWTTIYSKFGEELAVDDNYTWFGMIWAGDSVAN